MRGFGGKEEINKECQNLNSKTVQKMTVFYSALSVIL